MYKPTNISYHQNIIFTDILHHFFKLRVVLVFVCDFFLIGFLVAFFFIASIVNNFIHFFSRSIPVDINKQIGMKQHKPVFS